MANAWSEEVQSLSAGGFSDSDISSYQNRRREDLSNAGFSNEEVNNYFGIKEFDPKPLKTHFEENIQKGVPQEASRSTAEAPTPPKKAETFLEALDAGFQQSVTGLLKRGKMPDLTLSEDAGMFYRIASQIGSLAGDIPAMIAGGIAGRFTGGVAGGAAGSVIPGVGNAMGGAIGSTLGEGAGAFALPALMRKIMMDHYEKGDIKSAGEFWERASATFIEASKAGVVGMGTLGTGKIAGGIVAPGLTSAALKTSAEVATMVTLGKGLEGQLPEPMDFVDAAIVVGGLHGSLKMAGKLRSAYADHGVMPSEAAIEAQSNPIVKQELLSENPDNAVIAEHVTGEKPPASEIPKPYFPELSTVSKLPEEAPPTEGEAPEVSEARAKIRDQIVEVSPDKKNGFSFREFYTNRVDKLDPIKQAVEQQLGVDKNTPDAENPYSLARMVNDYKAKTLTFLKHQTIDFESLAKNGPSYDEVVAPHRTDLESFEAYMVADRAVEKAAQGVESDPKLLDAAKVLVKADKGKYSKAAEGLVDYQNRVLDYFYKSGGLTKEARDVFLEMNQKYIPYSRIFENEDGGYSKQGKPNSLKKLTAGLQDDLKMQSPLRSVMENTEALIKVAEKNRAVGKLVELIKENPDQTLFERVEANTKVTEISAKDMQKYADKVGLEGEAEALTVFRKQTKYNLSDSEFSADIEGKREVWKTDPLLAKSIKSLDGDTGSTNILFRMAVGITRMKKFGITVVPDFLAKNLFRDQPTAQAFSKYGRIPIWDTVLAMGDLIEAKVLGKENSHYVNWLKSGGANGSFIEIGDLIEQRLFHLNEQTGFMDHLWNTVRSEKGTSVGNATDMAKSPLKGLQLAAAIAEDATRLAEHKRITKGASEGSVLFEGGMGSRESTVDFQRIGAQQSAWNAITAFQNMNIQGLDRTIRAGAKAYEDIKEDPSRIKNHPFIQGVGLITTASIGLWYANHDEEWYKALPNWEKNTFWHFKASGTVWKVPKPQELGLLFGSLAERILDAFFTDNPHSFKDFADTVGKVMTPNVLPDFASTPLEHLMNRTFFPGSPVVSQAMEQYQPPYQYTDYTTESAKAIAKVIGYLPAVKDFGPKDAKLNSPMVVENYIKGWAGPLGMYILQLGDQALINSGIVRDLKPESTLADIPFVKAFVSRYPRANSQHILDFREQFQETEKVYATAKMLAEKGDLNEMQKVLALGGETGMVRLKEVNQNITDIGKRIHQIYDDKNIDKHQKRQIIDTLYFQMNQIAQAGNDTINSAKKQFKDTENKKK